MSKKMAYASKVLQTIWICCHNHANSCKIINIQALIIKNTRWTCNNDRTLLNCVYDKFPKHKFKFYYLRAYRWSRYCDHRVHVWVCGSVCL